MSTQTQANKFLEKLGIRRRNANASFPPEYYQAIEAAGYDPEQLLGSDPSSVNRINALFATKSVAQQTLGRDHERLLKSLLLLSNTAEFATESGVFADLGGGTGLSALWMSAEHKALRCEVYDHSSKSLAVGKSWADAYGITNVTFHEADYGSIASHTSSHHCDIVIASYAETFSEYFDVFGTNENYLSKENLVFRYRSLVLAMKNLLCNHGIGIFTFGESNPWSLELFCAALREAGFVIDWKLSSYKDFTVICVKTSGSSVFQSAKDDALGIATMSSMGTHREVHDAEAISLFDVFCNGQLFVEVQLSKRLDPSDERMGICRVSLFQMGGIAFLVERWNTGGCRGIYTTSANLFELSALAMRTVEKSGGTISNKYIHPELSSV